MWLVEFIFGMFIAYIFLSPKLRHLLFRHNHTPSIQTRVEREEKRERVSQISDKSSKVNNQDFVVPMNRHGKVIASEEDLAKWLSSNPNLKINEIKD